MKKFDLELRIKELELELNNLKSGSIVAEQDNKPAFQKSDSLVHALANNIPVYIAYVNADTLRYEFVNKLYGESFGVPKEKFIGSHIKDVIGETNYKFALKHLKEVKSGKTASYENAFDMISGKRWIKVNYTPVFDENSKVVGIALVSYDITERKQAEDTLHETEEHYKIMFESSPIAINITSGKTIIYANPSYLKMFGFLTLDELKNIAPLDLFTSEWRPKIEENIQRRAEGLSVPDFYEAECFRKVGSKFPIRMYLTRAMFSGGMATVAFTIDLTESKILEKKLQESEADYRKIYDNALEGIFRTSLEGKSLQCNWTLAKLLGYDSPNDITNTVTDSGHQVWVNAEERLKYTELFEKSDVVRGYECQFKRLDGKIIWVSLNSRLVRDENKKKLYYEGFINDVTERKTTEEMLRKSEKQYHLLFDEMLSGFAVHEIICDQSGKPTDYRFLSVNKAFEKMTGLDASDILGKTVLEVLPETEYSWIERYGKVALTGEPTQFENYASTLGKHYEVSAYCNEHGKFATIFNDITESKQAKEKLQNSESFLKETQSIANLGTYSLDITSGKWVSSEILDEILGIDFDFDKTIETWESLIHPEWQKVMKDYLIQEVIGNKTNFDKEYKIVRQNDKSERWVHGISNLKFNESNEPVTMIGSIQDITERKYAEIELIKAKEKAEESDRLKSAFLTNMSHEIRTPMNGILGFAELLKEPNLTSDDRQDYFQTMQISGARMLATINSIVDISKIESGLTTTDIKETNINEKIQFTYKFFKSEIEMKGLQFSFKTGLPTKEAIIKIDNEKVYAILTNLVKNAIKFTYEGSIEFGYEKKGEYLEFFVKDTGIGIPKNQYELIFERFRQGSDSNNRGYEGSGLGLSICKSYVEMLGGRIWVESKEGKGSIFYFTIPYNPVLAEIHTIKTDGFTENKDVPIKKLKILIVEDDEISYSLLSRVVQKISKKVLHAITGIQAVDACRNNPDLDLVLMDIRMPQMNGLEATQQIRQFNKDLIIIAQTAFGFSGDKEKAIEAGCNDYITKPINRSVLYELINNYFK